MAANPYPDAPPAPAGQPIVRAVASPPVTVRWGDQPWQVLDPERAGALLRLLRAKSGEKFGNGLRDVLLSEKADD